MASWISNDAGGRWMDLPRRDPTRALYDEAHVEKPDFARPQAPKSSRDAHDRALATLTPLVEAGRNFTSLSDLARTSGINASRLGNWRKRYPDAADLIQKLVAPQT